jgi:iron(III) transport system ATP-binding protein
MIRVEGLVKKFETGKEALVAIAGIDIEATAGEIVTLLGPSGCGKTTTLRCIAGLERATGGRIVIDGRTVADAEAGIFVPPDRRNLGMVFQSYAIWPHMTVFENVAYALEGRRLGRVEIRRRALAALEAVQLAQVADRPAPRLSGGQQQRVAIARAIVGQPQALLFDEPLSNLDAKLRLEMRNELRRLQRQIGITSIYVTHDQSEALAISDWIIVMKDGRVVERGRPIDIYRYPQHVFTAQFLGSTNIIAGTVESVMPDGVAVATRLGRIVGIDPARALVVGAKACVSVRPEDISTHEPAGAPASVAINVFEGQLAFAIFAGVAIEADVRCGDTTIHCLLGRDADLTLGKSVKLHARADACLVLSSE